MARPQPGNGIFFDLSPRAKVRVTGTDRIRFINGQITNDVIKATESNVIAACVLNAKGRINAHVFVSARQDAIVLDAAAELREILPVRLERYVIADDVQIEDGSGEFSIFHLVDSPRPDLTENCTILSANRFDRAGWDIWVDAAGHDEVAQQLSRTSKFCDDPCAELYRIEHGIPRWGRELTEEIIPLEANLESSCVDYDKGCYIGQEVVSRMKMSGQRNKKLCGLISLDAAPAAPGMKLYQMEAEKKESGWITSAIWSERLGKHLALGYVKRPFFETGCQLNAIDGKNPESAVVRLEVVDLPFVHDGAGIN